MDFHDFPSFFGKSGKYNGAGPLDMREHIRDQNSLTYIILTYNFTSRSLASQPSKQATTSNKQAAAKLFRSLFARRFSPFVFWQALKKHPKTTVKIACSKICIRFRARPQKTYQIARAIRNVFG